MNVYLNNILAENQIKAHGLIYTYPTVKAQTSDFTTGYSDGNQQGLSDRHSNVFHIGNICLNQSNSYCNGGYLDGFFSTLPTNTHTTSGIIVHEEHPKCHDNMTDCGKKTPPTPPPTPPCKKVNGTCV
jgi:hypothetical protein